MPIKAYSYIRFSTSEQMKGDSLRRQSEASATYAKEHDLVLDKELNMRDMGVSAYKGDNATTGALGAFLQAVEKGKVPKGSYLLVESLDRLSRQTVLSALQQFLAILQQGIIIVTLGDKMKYEIGNMEVQQLIISIMVMSRAHEESKTKSDRITAAWAAKIKNAENKPITSWVPAWMRLGADGKIEVIPERVAVIKRIYQWTLDGLGTSLIIRKLDDAKIEPWGMPDNIKAKKSAKYARGRRPKKWHPSYIQRLLSNRAVLGEFVPRQRSAGVNATPIKGYFPQIIDETTFYKARKTRESRDVSAGGKGSGPKGEQVTNLFSGLLQCGYSIEDNHSGYKCAGNKQSMFCGHKGKRDSTRYLQCARQRDGNAGCDKCRKYWRYDNFEKQFLTHVNEVDVSVLTGSRNALEREIKDIEAEIGVLKGKKQHNDKLVSAMRGAVEKSGEVPEWYVRERNAIEENNKELLVQQRRLESDLKDKTYRYKHSDKKKDDLSAMIKAMEAMSGKELLQLRLKLAEEIKSVVEHIEIYTGGFIRTPEQRKKESLKVRRVLDILEEEYPDISRPFFVVKYKSGEERYLFGSSKAAPRGYSVKMLGKVDMGKLEGQLQKKGVDSKILEPFSKKEILSILSKPSASNKRGKKR